MRAAQLVLRDSLESKQASTQPFPIPSGKNYYRSQNGQRSLVVYICINGAT